MSVHLQMAALCERAAQHADGTIEMRVSLSIPFSPGEAVHRMLVLVIAADEPHAGTVDVRARILDPDREPTGDAYRASIEFTSETTGHVLRHPVTLLPRESTAPYFLEIEIAGKVVGLFPFRTLDRARSPSLPTSTRFH